jgi:hypothetical protein
MRQNDVPDATYTTTWNRGQGETRFFTRRDGSRLRYYTAGTGPPLVLMHTVRTQLDYFQRVIPLVWDRYTVYALPQGIRPCPVSLSGRVGAGHPGL